VEAKPQPQVQAQVNTPARECGRQPLNKERIEISRPALANCRPFHGLVGFVSSHPWGCGFASTPGYVLSPASQAADAQKTLEFIDAILGGEAK